MESVVKELERLNAEFTEVMREAVGGLSRVAQSAQQALQSQVSGLSDPSVDTLSIIHEFGESARSLAVEVQMVKTRVRRMLEIEQEQRAMIAAERARIAAEDGEVA